MIRPFAFLRDWLAELQETYTDECGQCGATLEIVDDPGGVEAVRRVWLARHEHLERAL